MTVSAQKLRAMHITNNGIRLAAAAALFAGPATAQVTAFPTVDSFEYPVGSLRAAGIVGRVVKATRGETRYGPEREADVSVGENLPVLGFGSGDRPAFVGLTMRVGGRFSLDDPKSTLMGNDWVVGIHGTADRGPWRITAEVYHESSHLGDEYAEKFGARRIDWTREVGELWIGRRFGPFGVTAMGGYTLIDELPLARGSAALGLDYQAPRRSAVRAGLRPFAGVYAESQAYAGWKVTTTARAGVALQRGNRDVSIGAVFLNGLSNQRQFYNRRSRFVGFELRFDL